MLSRHLVLGAPRQETTGGKFPAGAGAGAGIVQNWPGPGIGRSENMAGAGAGAGAGAVNFSDASCFMMLNLYCFSNF